MKAGICDQRQVVTRSAIVRSEFSGLIFIQATEMNVPKVSSEFFIITLTSIEFILVSLVVCYSRKSLTRAEAASERLSGYSFRCRQTDARKVHVDTMSRRRL